MPILSLIMSPKRSLHVLPFLSGVRELLPQFGVPSQVLVRKTPKAAVRESPSLRNTLKPIARKKQKPRKQRQPILKSALMLLPMLSSLRTLCPSVLPHFAEVMQSTCNGFHPTATCLATRLLTLAKEGTTKQQVDRSTSYPEVKAIFKAKQHSKWRHKHPRYNKADPYYLLTRREQVTVFRLRTGHNRLNYHLYSKLRIS